MVSFDDNGYLLVLLEVRLHFAAQYFFQRFFFLTIFLTLGFWVVFVVFVTCCFRYIQLTSPFLFPSSSG